MHVKQAYADQLVTELCVVQFGLQSYPWLKKLDSCCMVVPFYYHLYDYQPNWTPISAMTISLPSDYKTCKNMNLKVANFSRI